METNTENKTPKDDVLEKLSEAEQLTKNKMAEAERLKSIVEGLLKPRAAKTVQINGKQVSVVLTTKSGVILNFVESKEAEEFFNKLI